MTDAGFLRDKAAVFRDTIKETPAIEVKLYLDWIELARMRSSGGLL